MDPFVTDTRNVRFLCIEELRRLPSDIGDEKQAFTSILNR